MSKIKLALYVDKEFSDKVKKNITVNDISIIPYNNIAK